VFISSVSNILCYKRSIFLPVHGFLPDIAYSWIVAGRRPLQRQPIYLRCLLDYFLFKETVLQHRSHRSSAYFASACVCVMTSLSEFKMLQDASLSFRK
jgi:hypothetical protein